MYLTLSNGRSAGTELQNTVGMYVRTLPVVVAGTGKNHRNESVVGYVRSVQKQLQMTFEREIYPYTQLVEKHRLHADIMLTWQGGMGHEDDGIKSIPLSLDTAKLPILITTYPDGYVLMVEYDKTRYGRKDMETLLSCFANAATTMAEAERICDISFLSSTDKAAILKMSAGGTLNFDRALPENYAYMIYTSGSTGRTKGAMIPHSALMNYVQVYTRMFEVTLEDHISHHITFSFDSHIRDFYPALAGGASLHFMPDEITKEPDKIYEFLEHHKITGSAYATAMGVLMLNGYDLKPRFVSVGGEALIGILSDNVRVFNVCGATEVTDVVCNYELTKGKY